MEWLRFFLISIIVTVMANPWWTLDQIILIWMNLCLKGTSHLKCNSLRRKDNPDLDEPVLKGTSHLKCLSLRRKDNYSRNFLVAKQQCQKLKPPMACHLLKKHRIMTT